MDEYAEECVLNLERNAGIFDEISMCDGELVNDARPLPRAGMSSALSACPVAWSILAACMEQLLGVMLDQHQALQVAAWALADATVG